MRIVPNKAGGPVVPACACGHRHGATACTVQIVSGPPSPPEANATARDPHPGRTVTRCPCTGYLGA